MVKSKRVKLILLDRGVVGKDLKTGKEIGRVPRKKSLIRSWKSKTSTTTRKEFDKHIKIKNIEREKSKRVYLERNLIRKSMWGITTPRFLFEYNYR